MKRNLAMVVVMAMAMALSLFAAGAVNAETPLYANYQPWTNLFPDEVFPPWTLYSTGTTGSASIVNSVGGVSALRVSSTNRTDYYFYFHEDGDLSITYPVELEASLRVVSGHTTQNSRDIVSILIVPVATTETQKRAELWIGKDEMFLMTSPSTRGASKSFVSGFHDNFHTYKVVVNADDSIDVYLDGGSTPTIEGTLYEVSGGGLTTPRISFGNGTVAAYGVMEFEYLTHNACNPL